MARNEAGGAKAGPGPAKAVGNRNDANKEGE